MTRKSALLLVLEVSRPEYRPFREMLRIAGSTGTSLADAGWGDIEFDPSGWDARQHAALLREWADALEQVPEP